MGRCRGWRTACWKRARTALRLYGAGRFRMKKSDVMRIIEEEGLRPAKRRGQNFLVSGPIRDKIIGAVAPSRDDRILEIGPGLGALTNELIEKAGHVTAVEIDSGFYRFLKEIFAGAANVTLVHADILKTAIEDTYTKIVSNLPYYCASEILFRMARLSAPAAYVMIQKELAWRIVAVPGDKNYGALSVTLRFYYEPEVLFNVSRESFYPRPEVDSSFMSLRRRAAPPLDGSDCELFHRVVSSAFWGRRKTMLRALSGSPHLDLDRECAIRILERAGIEQGVRGEELGLDHFVALTRECSREGCRLTHPEARNKRERKVR